uniref:DUF547 domain-containing protein n=1 Tax=Aegilops tauschii subsp. strangulata TaxID=200361 RepID=A0A452YGR5_AEGTS
STATRGAGQPVRAQLHRWQHAASERVSSSHSRAHRRARQQQLRPHLPTPAGARAAAAPRLHRASRHRPGHEQQQQLTTPPCANHAPALTQVAAAAPPGPCSCGHGRRGGSATRRWTVEARLRRGARRSRLFSKKRRELLAVEIGKELARKHFIHHVFRENDFEDGTQSLYRFLEHDPAVPRYYNFRGSTNDGEPKPAAAVGQRMTKIMVAILEAYASEDRRRLDYARVAASEEFRRYANLARDLQRADVFALPAGERLSFFLNLHNAMAIHAVIRTGQPAGSGAVDRRSFFTDFQYVVGGYPYSLTTIKNGILRGNRRQPYTIVKPFGASDKRLEVHVWNTLGMGSLHALRSRWDLYFTLAVQLAETKVNPLVHFALCNATRSSPTVRFYSAQGVEPELRHAAREFLLDGGVEIDLETRTVHLTRIIKWYRELAASYSVVCSHRIPMWVG